MTDTTLLSKRAGTRPRTTPWAPHIQQDQRGSREMQAALAGMASENIVMVYGPRNEQEVNVIFDLLQAAYRYAGGRFPEKEATSEALAAEGEYFENN